MIPSYEEFTESSALHESADPGKQKVYDEAKKLFAQLERLHLPLTVKSELAQAAQSLKQIAIQDGLRVGPPGSL